MDVNHVKRVVLKILKMTEPMSKYQLYGPFVIIWKLKSGIFSMVLALLNRWSLWNENAKKRSQKLKC